MASVKVLFRLWPYLRRSKLAWLTAYGCMIVLAVATAFLAFLSGPALHFIFTGQLSGLLMHSNGQLRSAWRWLPHAGLEQVQSWVHAGCVWLIPSLLMVTVLLKAAAQTGQFYLWGRISQSVLLALRLDLFSALLRQPPHFFTHRTHGDLLSRLSYDTACVEQALFYGCGPILRDGLALGALLAFCFTTDPLLSWITCLSVPLAVMALARFTYSLKKVSQRGQAAQGQIHAVCSEALAGVRVVQAFGAEAKELARLRHISLRYASDMHVSYFIRAIRTPLMETLGVFALAGLLSLWAHRIQHHAADPAHYISFFAAVVMMYEPLKKLGGVSDYVAMGASAFERILEILDRKPSISNAPGAVRLPSFHTSVVFENVGFTYDHRQVLSDVNLVIRSGQVVALVGASGSGKTTLAHLMPRFYDVTSGRLLIDRHDIRTLQLESLRKHISMVSQETFLFNSSVAENIAYAHPGASLSQIHRAAKAAYADEFICQMPQGYDTVIGERGVILSGGQKQRLAIARALLRNAPLLILDEATSNLDIESERLIHMALDTLLTGRTALVIAHRLSSVRHADVIAVLKQGRIVEQGCHSTLLAKQGEYARLYGLQVSLPKPPLAASL